MTPFNVRKEQFICLYDELREPMYRRFYFRLSNRERAKDLVQETFLKTWNYIRIGKEISNLKAFIYKVANNLIIDEYRKKKMVSLDSMRQDGFDPGGNDHERTVADAEFQNALKLIERLQPKYKQVVKLRFVHNLSPGEIATILHETENAISVKINRGLNKLRDFLK